MNPHQAGIMAAAEEMIRGGFIEETIDPETGVVIWTLTEKGRDEYAKMTEHSED